MNYETVSNNYKSNKILVLKYRNYIDIILPSNLEFLTNFFNEIDLSNNELYGLPNLYINFDSNIDLLSFSSLNNIQPALLTIH